MTLMHVKGNGHTRRLYDYKQVQLSIARYTKCPAQLTLEKKSVSGRKLHGIGKFLRGSPVPCSEWEKQQEKCSRRFILALQQNDNSLCMVDMLWLQIPTKSVVLT